MSKLIALDDGHGMQTGGKRTPPIAELGGRVIRENEFNREVVRLLDIELRRCGFKTLLTAPTDYDTPLSARTDLANAKKADFLISVHFNAMTGKFETSKAEGFSVHVHSLEYESAKLGRIVLKHLAEGTKQKSRGLVKQNLHMTRETKMPAILIEFGFMDNKREAMLMIDKGFQKECAVEVAKAVCEYYKVSYKAEVVAPAPKPQPTPQPAKPAQTPNSHTVEKGDTFYGIAKKYGIKVEDLQSYNARIKPTDLKVGDVIHLVPFPTQAVSKPAPKPEPKPTPKPVQKKKYLVLPKSEDSWKVYKLNDSPKAGNECGYLNPKKYGGLEYEIIGEKEPNVYIIKTQSFGTVKIYGHPSTGARIVEK
jgi:N-acetylmuramoyl-L-alanine amidase